jgi:hypothetical protein
MMALMEVVREQLDVLARDSTSSSMACLSILKLTKILKTYDKIAGGCNVHANREEDANGMGQA